MSAGVFLGDSAQAGQNRVAQDCADHHHFSGSLRVRQGLQQPHVGFRGSGGSRGGRGTGILGSGGATDRALGHAEGPAQRHRLERLDHVFRGGDSEAPAPHERADEMQTLDMSLTVLGLVRGRLLTRGRTPAILPIDSLVVPDTSQDRRGRTVAGVIIGLALLQGLLFAGKHLLFLLVARTDLTDQMTSMAVMIVLAVLVVGLARMRRWPLSVFPARFSRWYVLATIITAGLLIATPANYTDGWPAIMALIYGSVVTPVYEELVFRGLVWDRLAAVFTKPWVVYAWSVLLFGAWHLGYWDSVAYRVEIGLMPVMAWKAVTGAVYGVVLGALRLKTRNCYSTMLLHGVLNLFGR